MKTLKTIQAERIINTCDVILSSALETLESVRNNFDANNLPASKAKRIYRETMKKAVFYNSISFKVCNKYELSRMYSICDFEKYIKFFEY